MALEAGKDYWWCACGMSKNQPFCDGSHKGSGFSPMKYTPEKSGDYWLCACKHSSKKPLCDGTHKTCLIGMTIGKFASFAFAGPGAGRLRQFGHGPAGGVLSARRRSRCRTPSASPTSRRAPAAIRATSMFEAALVNAGTKCQLGRNKLEVDVVLRIPSMPGPRSAPA